MDEAEIFCDGASSGNPGDSGIGVVIRHKSAHSSQFTIHKVSEYIGTATNNMAEYAALIRGLKEARSLGFREVKVFLDSELVVKQINGIYKVKDSKLKRLWTQVQEILSSFDSYTITHVRRDLNKPADTLAKQAINVHSMNQYRFIP
ncbi:MAG: ribonuclease HI family protein [Nitrospirae bacterium]|nr:ribonuclease HI family protein [Nitrospirota bacterium]